MKSSTLMGMLLGALTLLSFRAFSQTGCPGCTETLPPLPADTVYIDSIPEGQFGVYYEEEFSFRFPKTTDPVAATDSTIPPGLTIDEFEIIGVQNLPAGIQWEANQTILQPADDTDGCFKLCGTPLESGFFLVEVTLKATVLIITQNVSVFLKMKINPPVSSNDGFTLTNNVGCGSITVDVQNNIPSNGSPGFIYAWDFGNGYQTADENPFSQTYFNPGVYPVTYSCTIDTIGYLLTSVTVTDVSCSDPFFNNPDLQLKVLNDAGNEIYSSAVDNNTDLPHTFSGFSIPILPGDYEIRIWDDDGGILGGDDLCGVIPFNQLSNGAYTSGDLSLSLNIIHPTTVVNSTDTVRVFALPAPPAIDIIAGADILCAGDSAILQSSYLDGNQWFQNGIGLIGATNPLLNVGDSGDYFVEYTDSNGCAALSDTLEIMVQDLPPVPAFINMNNLLVLDEQIDLPAGALLQWYLDDLLLPGEVFPELCATASGVYTLELYDPTSDCTNEFSGTVFIQPDGNCVTSLTVVDISDWSIAPNPSSTGFFYLIPDKMEAISNIQVFSVTGQLIDYFPSTKQGTSIDLSNQAPGMYIIRIQLGEKFRNFKVVIAP